MEFYEKLKTMKEEKRNLGKRDQKFKPDKGKLKTR